MIEKILPPFIGIRNNSALKQAVFRHLCGVNLKNTVVVSSLGRCGSTMLVNSLAHYYKRQQSRLDIVRLDDHINFDLSTDDTTIERGFDGKASEALRGQYLHGHVYKTHDFPPRQLPNHVKVIFLFGDPIDIALSAKELDKRYLTGVDSNYTALDLHIRNLRGSIQKKADIFDSDVLRLEEQFLRWQNKQTFPVLRLRYETMWENQSAIRDFIEIGSFRLPPKKQRKNYRIKHSKETMQNLERIYSRLAKKIKDADNCSVYYPPSVEKQ